MLVGVRREDARREATSEGACSRGLVAGALWNRRRRRDEERRGGWDVVYGNRARARELGAV